MTHHDQEEILRRALHAVADTIEPAPDGLERIRARLSTPRPLAVAWLMGAWSGVVQPLLLRMEPAAAGAGGRLSEQLASWLRFIIRYLRLATERLLAALRPLRPGSGMSRHEKLRSAIAFGAAAVIGAAGGFALSAGLPQQVISAAQSVFSPSSPPHNSGGGSGREEGTGTKSSPGATGASPHRSRKATPSSSHRCTPAPGTSPSPNVSSLLTPPASTSPTTTPPTSASPTPSPTPDQTASPTPSPTQTSGAVGPSASPGQATDGGMNSGAENPTRTTAHAARPLVSPTRPGAKATASGGPVC